MISVLIPTYNYKCYTLVKDLWRQLESCGCEYEVVVADDGGKDQVVAISNLRINELPHCRYIRREMNVGRAAIRNFLVSEAHGDWLLFLDCDSEIISESFIRKYLNAVSADVDLIIGGLVNPDNMPSRNVSLRYIYEKSIEYQRTLEYRRKYPYNKFSTFNFMIRKTVLAEIPFDEECTQYGYEDTLMGIELQLRGIRVCHIDNPLRHLGFESNNVFLAKTETALITLHSIKDKLLSKIMLGQVVLKLRKYRLTNIMKGIFVLLKPILRKNLLGDNPNMKIFAFYKLGYFISIKDKK